TFWQEIPQHFAHVVLDEWVVMPNHVHGVIIINNHPTVETQNVASLRHKRNEWKPNQFGPQSKNVASIIRGFKIGVTKYAHKQKIPFTWQPRFYDRVIRDENELNRIREYIQQNPLKWEWDRNNKNS
ncbi:transposase, partial [Candidatus Peregrinibacteria bacterium]|nr:transposase [Candidatus Peregrinibacteria bacterium]